MAEGLEPPDLWNEENASVEVWRWGNAVRVAIRSEQSVGKCIELTLEEARALAADLDRATRTHTRKVRDEPQA